MVFPPSRPCINRLYASLSCRKVHLHMHFHTIIYLIMPDPSVNFNQQLLGHSFRVRPTRGEQADLHHFAVNYTFSDGRSVLVPWAASHLGSVAYNDCLTSTNHSTQQLLDDIGLFRLKSSKDAEAENTTQIQVENSMLCDSSSLQITIIIRSRIISEVHLMQIFHPLCISNSSLIRCSLFPTIQTWSSCA